MDKQKQIEEITNYFLIRNKDTGLYYRGKGENRWGKYYNQASVYRIKKQAENALKEIAWRGENAEIVPIYISKIPEEAAGYWKERAEMWKQCTYDIRKETAEKFAERLKQEYANYLGEDEIYVDSLLFSTDKVLKEFTE